MKSTEETGMDFINKPDWAKIINIQKKCFKQQQGKLGFGQNRGCGQIVCVSVWERERGLKEVMVKEAGFFPTACVFVFVCCVSVNIVVYVCAVSVG